MYGYWTDLYNWRIKFDENGTIHQTLVPPIFIIYGTYILHINVLYNTYQVYSLLPGDISVIMWMY